MTPDTDETRTRAQETGQLIDELFAACWKMQPGEGGVQCHFCAYCRGAAALASLTARLHQVEPLAAELASIKELCARRPAMDESTLYDNVAKAIRMAAQADVFERRALAAERRLHQVEQERDEALKRLCIVELSTPLEEDLSAKIDEMCRYLAMQDGFTLNGIARLLNECQRRMAADYDIIGRERRESKSAKRERDEARRERDAARAEIRRAFEAGFDEGAWVPPSVSRESRHAYQEKAFTAYQETQKTKEEPK